MNPQDLKKEARKEAFYLEAVPGKKCSFHQHICPRCNKVKENESHYRLINRNYKNCIWDWKLLCSDCEADRESEEEYISMDSIASAINKEKV